MTITLKTFYGFESVLADELIEMGFSDPKILNRAVQIKGAWKDVYYLNIHVRCAITVLVEIASFDIRKEKDLYDQASKIRWTNWFDVDKTFAVKGAVYSDLFRHSRYPFLLVKDAIVDSFRKQSGDRPNVNTSTPQVAFDVYIDRHRVTVSLNTSGAPLFQRGYRQSTGVAPLNEVVAAGLLRMSGWDKKSTLIDPFCGSGTFLIEAALMAADLPPTIERRHFALKNFANFDADLWDELQDSAKKRVTGLPCKIFGSDRSAEMVTKTRRNLRGLPIGRFVETQVQGFEEARYDEEDGWMICNPPYGERMGDDINELYERLGNWMKSELPGFKCWILSSNKEAFKFVGLKPDQKHKVFNGDLECSFRSYVMFAGSRKEHLTEINN